MLKKIISVLVVVTFSFCNIFLTTGYCEPPYGPDPGSTPTPDATPQEPWRTPSASAAGDTAWDAAKRAGASDEEARRTAEAAYMRAADNGASTSPLDAIYDRAQQVVGQAVGNIPREAVRAAVAAEIACAQQKSEAKTTGDATLSVAQMRTTAEATYGRATERGFTAYGYYDEDYGGYGAPYEPYLPLSSISTPDLGPSEPWQWQEPSASGWTGGDWYDNNPLPGEPIGDQSQAAPESQPAATPSTPRGVERAEEEFQRTQPQTTPESNDCGVHRPQPTVIPTSNAAQPPLGLEITIAGGNSYQNVGISATQPSDGQTVGIDTPIVNAYNPPDLADAGQTGNTDDYLKLLGLAGGGAVVGAIAAGPAGAAVGFLAGIIVASVTGCGDAEPEPGSGVIVPGFYPNTGDLPHWQTPLTLKPPAVSNPLFRDFFRPSLDDESPLVTVLLGDISVALLGGVTPYDPRFIQWQKDVYGDVNFNTTDQLTFVTDLTDSIYTHCVYNSGTSEGIGKAAATIKQEVAEGKCLNRKFTEEEVKTFGVTTLQGALLRNLKNGFSTSSIILNQDGICRDFSVVENYMLGQSGIQSEVLGIPSHSVLLAKINGQDYVVDPTMNKVMPYNDYMMNFFRGVTGSVNWGRKDGVPDTDLLLNSSEIRRDGTLYTNVPVSGQPAQSNPPSQNQPANPAPQRPQAPQPTTQPQSQPQSAPQQSQPQMPSTNYTVKSGDTVYSILRSHGYTPNPTSGDIAKFQQLNPNVNINNIHVGQTVKVPQR